MYRIVYLSFMVLLLMIYFYLHFYKRKKNSEYRNDERWVMIQKKSGEASMRYFDFLLVLTAIYITADLFMDISFTISLDRGVSYLYMLIMLRSVVELVALKHFDRVY